MKMKTYSIVVSDKFLSKHYKKNRIKNRHLFLNRNKIHAICNDYQMWEKRIKEVHNGQAVISIRKWVGIPYRSKQKEICHFTTNEVDIQKLIFSRSKWTEEDNKQHFMYWTTVDGTVINIDEIAKNDGFPDFVDFVSWFDKDIDKQKPDDDCFKHLELAIIHFTKFRY